MKVSNPAPARGLVTGMYTGDGGATRQVTTGFKCSFVVIYVVGQIGSSVLMFSTISVDPDGANDQSAFIQLHATNGIDILANTYNWVAREYHYWAIAE